MKRFVCVVDLEATCWLPVPTPPRVNEIIEIGAVMAALPAMVEVGALDVLIRPQVNPTLSEFCTQLTTITQAMVDGAVCFPEALLKFRDWIDLYGPAEDVLFASYGPYDKRQLTADCELYGMTFPFDGEHLNIKNHVCACLNIRRRGQARVLTHLGLEPMGTPHRGIDDARNALRILQKVGM